VCVKLPKTPVLRFSSHRPQLLSVFRAGYDSVGILHDSEVTSNGHLSLVIRVELSNNEGWGER